MAAITILFISSVFLVLDTFFFLTILFERLPAGDEVRRTDLENIPSL